MAMYCRQTYMFLHARVHHSHKFYCRLITNMSSFDAESPVGQQLKASLIVELGNKFGLTDDAEDVSDYILVLIGSNKTATEIVAEVKEIVDIGIDEGFVNTIFMEIQRLMQGEQQTQETQQMQQQQIPQQQQIVPPEQQQVPPQEPQPEMQREPLGTDQQTRFQGSFSDDMDMAPSLPSGPRGMRGGRGRGRGAGGVGKGRGALQGGKRSFATQNAANFEKVLAMSNANVNLKQFIQKPSLGRCKDFPQCSNKQCVYAHPTKICFSFPNCKNPPGTCNYLHPGEDDELMAKLDESRKEYLERKNRPVERAGTLGLCKFGILCSKELCPFGHPTPANHEAKVLVLEWCPAGKACQDPQCAKAHPSPNYQAPPPQAKSKPAPSKELLLEQCKFGPNCTKANCPRRHATSVVPCRDGASCTKPYCYFSHPIDEDCRFGSGCTNKHCMFRHPDGRLLQSNTWTKEDGTSQRAFAVADDQVMEQAVQE